MEANFLLIYTWYVFRIVIFYQIETSVLKLILVKSHRKTKVDANSLKASPFGQKNQNLNYYHDFERWRFWKISVITRHQGDILSKKLTPSVSEPVFTQTQKKTKVDGHSSKGSCHQGDICEASLPFGQKYKNFNYINDFERWRF